MKSIRSLCKRIQAVFLATLLMCACGVLPAQASSATPNYTFYGSSAFKSQVKNIVAQGKVPTGGKTYYVSKKGSDTNAGSKSKPFKTLKKGISVLKSGDTLLIRGGTYTEKMSVALSGKSSQYITIKSYPDESVTISGSKLTGDNQTLLQIKGSYINIDGLTFSNLTGDNACGVSILPSSRAIILQNVTINGIKASSKSNDEPCANAILMLGDNAKKAINEVLVYNCYISECSTGYSEAVSITGNTTNVNIVNNTVRNISNIGIDFSGNYGYCSDPALDFPRNCIAAGNLVENCVAGYATSHGIYVDGGQTITIQNNKVNLCGGGIEVGAEEPTSLADYQTKNVKVLNNTLQNNIETGIAIGGYDTKLGNVDSVKVSGNLCLENGVEGGEILALSKCSNIEVSGNAFISATSGGETTIVSSQMSKSYTKNITFTKNVYSNGGSKTDTSFTWYKKSYTTLSKWMSVSGDKSSTYSDTTTITGASGTIGSTLYQPDSTPDTKGSTFWMIQFFQSFRR